MVSQFFNGRSDGEAVVEHDVEPGGGESVFDDLCDVFEDVLAPAAATEPVVREGDARLTDVRGGFGRVYHRRHER